MLEAEVEEWKIKARNLESTVQRLQAGDSPSAKPTGFHLNDAVGGLLRGTALDKKYRSSPSLRPSLRELSDD